MNNHANRNAHARYGSSRFASFDEVRQHFKGGIPIGYYEQKPLLFNTDAPLCLIAGSGAGKLTSVLARIVCSYAERQFILDLKGELTAISLDTQARYGKHHYCINPYKKHDLPVHCVNPLAILTATSASLTADCKLIAGFLVSSQNEDNFFTSRAREWIAKLLEFQVLRDGKTDLIRFNSLINAIDGNIDIWAQAIAEGEQSNREDIKRTFAEMKQKQLNVPKEFGGIMGVIYNALDFLSDNNIAHTLSGSDFSLDVLCNSKQKANISLIIPAENIAALGGFMRLMIGITALHKSRNPASPKVLFILDEAAQLGNFAHLRQMMSYGRGAGIQPLVVFQDTGQITANHGVSALQTFIGSAQTRIFFGVRDHITARMVSDMLGTQTLEYDHHLQQKDAKRRKLHAIANMMDGGDIFRGVLDARYEAMAQKHQTKQARDLMTPSEVLQMPHNRMLIFTGDTAPIYADKINYFERADMAGLYFPNPYHPPENKVQVRTWRKVWRDVVTTKTPRKYRDYPQYQGRQFRYIRGYKF